MKGIWNFVLTPALNEVAVRQHSGAATDRGAVDRRDQWLVEVDQCIHEAGPWRLA
jgi:hypothetical protein